MSRYEIKNVQRYQGKSVTISTNDMRHSIAVYGETDIECLEYALHFLKNKDECTQPIKVDNKLDELLLSLTDEERVLLAEKLNGDE